MKRKLNSSKIPISSFFNCPVCGKKGFKVKQKIDEIPYIGEVLATFASCKYCKYKTHDIIPLSEKNFPKIQKVKIENKKDLEKRVVKSKYCFIKIPELDLEINPGPNSECYISNLEGLIDRLIDSFKKIKTVKKSKKNKEKMNDKIKTLKNVKKLKEKITIIFKDETRHSIIINSKKVK